MRTKPLGVDGPHITTVGLGTAPLGSSPDWRLWWGHQDAAQAIRTVQAAVDAGVNWIDTAPFYGWGRAEELLGRALAGRRDDVAIFTKCGTLNDGAGGVVEDLRPETIHREADASLGRLGTDVLDVLQFHDPDPNVPIEESWGALHDLVAAGKVRHGGLSNHPLDLVARAGAVHLVTLVQHHYSVLDRAVEAAILPHCVTHGIGFLAWSPLESGFLTDGFALDALDPADFRRGHPNAEEPRYSRTRQLVTALAAIAAPHGRSAADLALAYLLHRPGVTGVIVGARAEAEARALPAIGEWALDAAVMAAVDDVVAAE